MPIKNELDNGKTITYKQKFIDRLRFISISLSKLVKYLSGRLHSGKCTQTVNPYFILEYLSVKDDQLIFRCFGCKKYF